MPEPTFNSFRVKTPVSIIAHKRASALASHAKVIELGQQHRRQQLRAARLRPRRSTTARSTALRAENSDRYQPALIPVPLNVRRPRTTDATTSMDAKPGHWQSTAVLTVGAALAILLIGYLATLQLGPVGLFLVAILASAFVLAAWRRNPGKAQWYLLTGNFLLLTGMIYAPATIGLLPQTVNPEHGVIPVSATMTIMLACAFLIVFAYRANELWRQERNLPSDAIERIERRVSERTSELSRALNQLQGANRRLREHSRRDSLTGVHNRGFLSETLEHELELAYQRSEPFSLLMVDLDHFKRINDSYGHLAGDHCLIEVAGKLSDCIREGDDFVARFGGEEFVVLLANTNAEAATERAELIRREIEGLRIFYKGQVIACTASIGVCTQSGNQHGIACDLLQHADQALYQAKNSGRNRVAVATT